MDIAAISVLTTGVVGVAGVSVPLLLDRRAELRRAREAYDARMDELRLVLDEAAQALVEAHAAAPDIDDARAGPDAIAAAALRTRKEMFAVWAQDARIAVRLSMDDALFESFRWAHDALGALYRYYRDSGESLEPESDPVELHEHFVQTMAGFYREAAARIGPSRRPSPRSIVDRAAADVAM